MPDLMHVWLAAPWPLAVKFRLAYRFGFLRHQAHHLPFIAPLIDPAKACLDVGANLGFFTEYLARRSRHVYAFEPNPVICAQLARCCRANVTPIAAAAGDQQGQAVLHVPGRGGWDHGRGALKPLADADRGVEYHVAVERLDDRPWQNIGFIKMDVEGCEDAAIDGARELLLREKPNLFIEIEQRHRDRPVAACVERLAALGYAAHFVWEGKLRPFAEFRAPIHQDPRFAGWAGYAGDFIFRPVDRI